MSYCISFLLFILLGTKVSASRRFGATSMSTIQRFTYTYLNQRSSYRKFQSSGSPMFAPQCFTRTSPSGSKNRLKPDTPRSRQRTTCLSKWTHRWHKSFTNPLRSAVSILSYVHFSFSLLIYQQAKVFRRTSFRKVASGEGHSSKSRTRKRPLFRKSRLKLQS